MTASQVIVLATPVFLLLIAAEFGWARARARRSGGSTGYNLGDAINSISLGILSQLSGLYTKLLSVGIYAAVTGWLPAPESAAAFWRSLPGFLLALLFYDFCYYWNHRAGHRVALLWAAHVVHHQSPYYNLSTALRQSSSGALLGWIFYLPMALAGVPLSVFGIVALVDLLYQFWVHTEQIGRLGAFDRVFCSPSNHRVHHAINDAYLDRNYGGILVLWDRLFGTFREETEPCVYGTRQPLASWDPVWANAQVYWTLARRSLRATCWSDRLRIWLKPPGWRTAAEPAPPAQADGPADWATRCGPPLSTGVAVYAALAFGLLLLGVATVLWQASLWSDTRLALCSLALLVSYWALGAVLQGRLQVAEMLLAQTAAVATAAAALGWTDLAMLSKPLPLLIASLLIAKKLYLERAEAGFYSLLLAALAASLIGDVLLMLPGDLFVPGLAAFLVAHVLYLLLLRRGLSAFPSRPALVATLGAGALVYALLWPGLRGGLLASAVAAYVLVIALMAAQALGRAAVLRDRPSRAVAWGAILFLISDTLLGINRFVVAVPLSPLWVLGSYFLAQALIAGNLRPVGAPR